MGVNAGHQSGGLGLPWLQGWTLQFFAYITNGIFSSACWGCGSCLRSEPEPCCLSRRGTSSLIQSLDFHCPRTGHRIDAVCRTLSCSCWFHRHVLVRWHALHSCDEIVSVHHAGSSCCDAAKVWVCGPVGPEGITPEAEEAVCLFLLHTLRCRLIRDIPGKAQSATIDRYGY